MWEAKDEHDDLGKEVRRNLSLGFPDNNILFQAPTQANERHSQLGDYWHLPAYLGRGIVLAQESANFMGQGQPVQSSLVGQAAAPALLPLVAVIRQASVFTGLSLEECAQVADAAESRNLARGDMLFMEGTPVRHISLLVTGRMKVTQLGPSGHQVILRLKMPGQIISEMGLSPGSPHCSTAEALESCRVILWNATHFEELVERFPVLHRNIARLLADRLQQLEERFRELATEQVAPRLARTLIRLLQQVGNRVENGHVRIDLSREELAQMAGTTLFTVSRLFSEWEDSGIVRAVRGAVLVLNPKLLFHITESAHD